MGYFFLKLIECLEQEGTLFGLHNLFTNMRITYKSSGKVCILVGRKEHYVCSMLGVLFGIID